MVPPGTGGSGAFTQQWLPGVAQGVMSPGAATRCTPLGTSNPPWGHLTTSLPTAERGPGGSCPPGPRVGAEKPEQPGLWYLAATPAATAATVCLAPVPLVPYVPSML